MRYLPRLVMGSALVLAAVAQTPSPQATVANASISGAVRDRGTGAPLADYTVRTSRASGPGGLVTAVTDDQGHYELTDLPPGQRVVTVAAQRDGPGILADGAGKIVTLSGKDLRGIDFAVTAAGSITGRVIDEYKQPVPGIQVNLVMKHYNLGKTEYQIAKGAKTDGRGTYTLTGVDAGRAFYLMAGKAPKAEEVPPHAETPLDPHLRKRVPMRTWYPNSTQKESAEVVVLRPGERREDVNIELKKSPSYCISGILSGPGGPGPTVFSVVELDPSVGYSQIANPITGSSTVMMSATPKATTAADGEFRVCDLPPGSYQFIAVAPGGMMGSVLQVMGDSAIYPFQIADRDLTGLRISTSPGITVNTTVVLDGQAPPAPITAKLNLSARPLYRSGGRDEGHGDSVEIPGAGVVGGLRMDDYGVMARVSAPGLYVKDISYGGSSVQYDLLRIGSGAGNAELRVVIGQDGATIRATVSDDDGNPVADARFLIMPAQVASDAALAARIVPGQTDQMGQYTSGTLAPGRYYVVATNDSLDDTPESIGKLWRAHQRFQEIELAPSGTAQVALKLVKLQ